MKRINVSRNTVPERILLTDEEMEYEYWFAGIQEIPSKKKYLLRERMKTGRAVYYIEETQLARLEFLSEKERQVLKAAAKQTIGNACSEAAKKESGLFRGFPVIIRSGFWSWQISRMQFMQKGSCLIWYPEKRQL